MLLEEMMVAEELLAAPGVRGHGKPRLKASATEVPSSPGTSVFPRAVSILRGDARVKLVEVHFS